MVLEADRAIVSGWSPTRELFGHFRFARLPQSSASPQCSFQLFTRGVTRDSSAGVLAVLLLLMTGLVVLLEQVFAKVAGEVAPHGVDVVGIVLRVI